MRVLIVEDDEILREGLLAGLAMEGFTVDAVGDLQDAQNVVAGAEHALIVLDIALPDGSGLDLLRSMRRQGDKRPVLLLTARVLVEDRVEGLDAGADDYLLKPFELCELAARIRALHRRSIGSPEAVLIAGDLILDLNCRTAEWKGKPVNLLRREFAILQLLAERPGHILSRSRIEDCIYGWQEEVGSNAVEVHVHHLRGKLDPQLIQTVRGEGYRMRRL